MDSQCVSVEQRCQGGARAGTSVPTYSSMCPQLQVAQLRIQYLEQSTVERAIVSRQEAVICDLENKTEFQKVQMKRFEVPRIQELLGAGAGRGV